MRIKLVQLYRERGRDVDAVNLGLSTLAQFRMPPAVENLVRLELATCLNRVGREAYAQVQLERVSTCLQIPPVNALGWLVRGRFLDTLNRYDEAIAAYEFIMSLSLFHRKPVEDETRIGSPWPASTRDAPLKPSDGPSSRSDMSRPHRQIAASPGGSHGLCQAWPARRRGTPQVARPCHRQRGRACSAGPGGGRVRGKHNSNSALFQEAPSAQQPHILLPYGPITLTRRPLQARRDRPPRSGRGENGSGPPFEVGSAPS